MMEKIPILRSLRRREEQAGKDVALRDAAGSQRAAPPGGVGRPQDPQGVARGSPLPAATVSVGNLPHDAHVSDLKRALRELGLMPPRLTWQGPRRPALLHYQDPASAQRAVSCLQGLSLGTSTLRAALAEQQGDR